MTSRARSLLPLGCLCLLAAACLDTSRRPGTPVAATEADPATPPAGAPTPGTPDDPMPTAAVPSPLVSATLPPRPDTSTKPPLLVLLHGYGSNEHDLLELARHMDPRFRVVSFRAPLELAPSSNAWFAVRFQPGGDNAIDVAQWDRSRRALVEGLHDEDRAQGREGHRGDRSEVPLPREVKRSIGEGGEPVGGAAGEREDGAP